MQKEKIEQDKFRISIYTDGACKGNPGPAGAGIVMIYGKYRKEWSFYLGKSTNNAAELFAVKIALEKLKIYDYPICFYVDSEYVIGALSKTFKIRKNLDIIAQIKAKFEVLKEIDFIKVSAHTQENLRADYLAKLALRRFGY